MENANYFPQRIPDCETHRSVLPRSAGMCPSTPPKPNLRGKVVLHCSTSIREPRQTKPRLWRLDDWGWGMVRPGKHSFVSSCRHQSHYPLVHSSTRWNAPRDNTFLRQNQHISSNRRPCCASAPLNSCEPSHGRSNEVNLSRPFPPRTTPLSEIPRSQEITPWSDGKSPHPSLPRYHL